LTFILLFSALAFTYLRYTKPVYESAMILQLSEKDTAKEVLDFQNLGSRDNQLSGVVELLRSELLFKRAVKSLSLNVSLYSRGNVLTEEKYLSSSYYIQPYELYDSTLINKEVRVDYDGENISLSYLKNGETKVVKGYVNEHLKNEDFDVVVKVISDDALRDASTINELYFTFNSIESVTERLRKGLKVVPVEVGAKTISISYRGYTPQLCKDITLAISNSYISFDEDMQRKGSENILGFIDSQLDSLSNELKSSKDSLMIFQRKSNLPNPEEAASNITDNISKLQDQLFLIEDELNSLITVHKMIGSSPNRLEVYKMLPEMLGKSYETSLVKHIEELHLLLERKEDLLYRVTPENSEVKLLDRKVKAKTNLIQRSVSAIENRLMQNARVLKGNLAKYKDDIFELPEKKMEFNRLKNIQNLNEKYFTLLTEKKVLYAISDAGYASSNRILSMPKVATTPVEPSKNFIYSSFIMFGIILGLGVMFLKYVMFNEINLIEDLESVLPEKASILGGVPMFKYNMEYSQLIVAEAPKSSMAESMRKIRTNLSYINPNYRTIAISSSISGEGKTFVALNLAGIIAMSGKKTVLLDLDLRKPKIHLGMDVDNTNGMSSLIVGQSKLEDCIHSTKLKDFDFITAGPTPPNPSELLLSDGFKDVISQLKELYDVIVIDNPPVGLVSDGVRNLTDADIPIYVFKSHYSKRSFTNRVKELFEVQQLKSLNVILNGIQATKSSSYGYGYGYGYGSYNNGYMEDDTKVFKQAAKDNKWYRKLFSKWRK